MAHPDKILLTLLRKKLEKTVKKAIGKDLKFSKEQSNKILEYLEKNKAIKTGITGIKHQKVSTPGSSLPSFKAPDISQAHFHKSLNNASEAVKVLAGGFLLGVINVHKMAIHLRGRNVQGKVLLELDKDGRFSGSIIGAGKAKEGATHIKIMLDHASPDKHSAAFIDYQTAYYKYKQEYIDKHCGGVMPLKSKEWTAKMKTFHNRALLDQRRGAIVKMGLDSDAIKSGDFFIEFVGSVT